MGEPIHSKEQTTYHRSFEEGIFIPQNEVQNKNSQWINIDAPMLVLTNKSTGIRAICFVDWFQGKIPVGIKIWNKKLLGRQK